MRCRSARDHNRTCSPLVLRAEPNERQIIEHLAALTVDVGTWIERRRGELDVARQAWRREPSASDVTADALADTKFRPGS